MSVRPSKFSAGLPLILIVLLLAAAVSLPRLVQGSPHLPGAFTKVSSLDDALDRSEREGLPALALVTSDACAACNHLKRVTLPDPRVAALVADRFIPVIVNERQSPMDARRLPYVYLPTTLVIRDRAVVARLEGFRPPDEYASWLRDAADAARDDAQHAAATP